MSEKPDVQVGQVYRDKRPHFVLVDQHTLISTKDGGFALVFVCVPCSANGKRAPAGGRRLAAEVLQARFELVKDLV